MNRNPRFLLDKFIFSPKTTETGNIFIGANRKKATEINKTYFLSIN